MHRTIFFILAMLSFPVLNASTFESNNLWQDWCLGSIVLNDGTLLEGNLKYDLEAEAVHLKVNGAIRTFVANQIVGFNFSEEEYERKRFFVTLFYEAKGGYKRPKLFEVAYSNMTSLLVREENAYSSWTTKDPSLELTPSRRYARGFVPGYDYYLSDSEGNVTEINAKGAKAITRSFENHHKKLRAYVRSEKLKVRELEDLVKLVHYYNVIEASADLN